jgi:iron complex outermembrane receptor protein
MGAVVASQAALAQDAGGGRDNEIVVTARRVQENLQDVPVAVTAFEAEALEEKAINTPYELQFHSPSLAMQTAFGGLVGGFTLRGLAGGVQNYFAEFAGGPVGAQAPFFDIQSVQVLNGPQGTLFGRANTAGAVLVYPQRPVLSGFEASLEGRGGNYSQFALTGVVNYPIIEDELAVRVAVHGQRRAGYINVIGGSDPYSTDNNTNIRVGVEWNPGGGRFTNYALLNWYDVDQRSTQPTIVAANPALASLNPSSGTMNFLCGIWVAQGFESNAATCASERLALAASIRADLVAEAARTNSESELRRVRFDPNANIKEEYEQLTFVNRSEYDFGDLGFTSLSVQNILGYVQGHAYSGFSLDGAGGIISSNYFTFAGAGVSANEVGNQATASFGPWGKFMSEELQINGVIGDDLIDWRVGAYYSHAPTESNVLGSSNFFRIFQGLYQANRGWAPAGGFPLSGFGRQQALFGQANVDLSALVPFIAGLHATAGYRYSWDDSRFTQVNAVLQPSGRYLPGTTRTTTRTSSEGENTILGLDANITDDLLVYVAARTGYRPGGINTVANATGLPFFSPTFGPETVEDTEIGLKYSFEMGDFRGAFNLATYKTDYTDIQRSLQFASGAVQTIYTANVAAAQIEGIEIQANIANAHWDAQLTYSNTDAAYTKWLTSDPFNLLPAGSPQCLPSSPVGGCLIDLSGEPFQNTPENQVSLTLGYQTQLGNDNGDIRVSVTTAYRDRAYFGSSSIIRSLQLFPATLDDLSQTSFTKVNARVEWTGVAGSNLDAALFVDNLTDEIYAIGGTWQLSTLGFATKNYAAPRFWGVELRYHFGE